VPLGVEPLAPAVLVPLAAAEPDAAVDGPAAPAVVVVVGVVPVPAVPAVTPCGALPALPPLAAGAAPPAAAEGALAPAAAGLAVVPAAVAGVFEPGAVVAPGIAWVGGVSPPPHAVKSPSSGTAHQRLTGFEILYTVVFLVMCSICWPSALALVFRREITERRVLLVVAASQCVWMMRRRRR